MILAIDIGSTQMKLLLMDEAAQVVDLVAERYGTLTLKAGWVEQNPEDWSKAFKKGNKKLV